MNKIVSGIIKGAIVATVGFVVGIAAAEKQSRKEAAIEIAK